MTTETGTDAPARAALPRPPALATLAAAMRTLDAAVSAGDPLATERAAKDLATLLAQQALPHVAGEEVTLYPAARRENGILASLLASAEEELRDRIHACITLAYAPDAFRQAADRLRFLAQAHETAALLVSHLRSEGTYVRPLLGRATHAAHGRGWLRRGRAGAR